MDIKRKETKKKEMKNMHVCGKSQREKSTKSRWRQNGAKVL